MHRINFFLIPLMACSPYVSDPQCIQVDVVPQASELDIEGESSLLVDVAVCSCGSQSLCETDLLLPGTSIELSTTLGEITPTSMILPNGRGSATLTKKEGQNLEGTATITATAGDWIGNGQVSFVKNEATPSDISFSAGNESLMADGDSSTILQVQATNADGKTVKVHSTSDQLDIYPSQSTGMTLQNGIAQFIYTAPKASDIQLGNGETKTVTLYAIIDDIYFSEPLNITLTAASEESPIAYAIIPENAKMTVGSSLLFQAQGHSGTLQWNADSCVDLTCNDGALIDCDGESIVSIGLNSMEMCEEGSDTFELWVTDADTGEQKTATITVK